MRSKLQKLFMLWLMFISCVACGESEMRSEVADKSSLVKAAEWQIGKTIYYDPSYVALAYPKGDLPLEKGVCTDVVIRALRRACGLDLQQLVHQDMVAHFSAYPQRWGLRRPDRNIDHRRVPNLQTYFKRQGWELDRRSGRSNYQPGDLVTCTVAGRLPHIMIVSGTSNKNGLLMVIHNIGGGTKLEDSLLKYPITGHYRVK